MVHFSTPKKNGQMLPYIYSKCNARCQPAKMIALRGLSSCARLTLFQSRAKASSDRATPSYRGFDTRAQSPATPWIAPSAVRAVASRLIAVVQSWAAQANPDCNSELSAQVALRKPSPIASGSDALRSQGCWARRWGDGMKSKTARSLLVLGCSYKCA